MNLGVLLPMGSSLKQQSLDGQDKRMAQYYLKPYNESFERVFFFTYDREPRKTSSNVQIVGASFIIHRYLYALLIPFLQFKIFLTCDIFRCFQPLSTPPAIIGKIFFGKNFVVNYNYDGKKWAAIDGKYYLIPFIFILEQFAFRFSSKVFVPNKTMQNYVSQFVPIEKTSLIPNGVDVEKFKPQKVKTVVTKNKRAIVLSIGRLEKQKNFPLLINAVSLIDPSPRLLIIGRGSMKKSLLSLAKQKKVSIKIVDFVPNDELPKLFQMANIYVQSSIAESAVKTLLEAMSCAMPCVGTNVAGINEMIVDGVDGLICQSDAGSMANKINQLLTQRKLAVKLGNNARDRIIKNHNIIKSVAKEISLMKTISNELK